MEINKIKKIPLINFINNIRKQKTFIDDGKIFMREYMYSFPITKEKLEYDILLEVHKLEKGFAVMKKQRPFGVDRIKRIIRNIQVYEKNKYENSFAYNLAYSSLIEYKKFYEEKKWTNREEYLIILNFLKKANKFENIPVGAYNLKKSDFIEEAMSVDYDRFISYRRSVRNFSSKKLKEKDIKKAVKIAIKTPTACNRQMCKIYYIKNEENKKYIESYAQGIGLFDLTNVNYFVLTFDLSSSHFLGERNQGWFNCGLVTMNFINGLHSLGIGSCCIQFGNTNKEENTLKKLINIPPNERIGVIVCAGYYDEISRIPYSSRKPIEEIYRER